MAVYNTVYCFLTVDSIATSEGTAYDAWTGSFRVVLNPIRVVFSDPGTRLTSLFI